MTDPVCPAYALAHCGADFLSTLTEAERFVLPHLASVWLRPEQFFPAHDWRSVTFICGRGWGKTYAIAAYINAEIEAGRIRFLGLMAPNEDRVDEVQIQNLIDAAPPWFKPERAHATIVWPNGVTAEIFTPAGRNRGSNLDFAWLTELVDWPTGSRVEAFNNITTACRVGRAQFVCDTTSQGKNELILALEATHEIDPDTSIIVRGTTFDNPMMSRKYLQAEVKKYRGRRLQEELLGRVFKEAAGALWSTETIEMYRRPIGGTPATVLTILALDPALVDSPTADEFGIIVGSRGIDGHVYIEGDMSGRHPIDVWSTMVVDRCEHGEAAGVVVETNHAGRFPVHAILSEARTRNQLDDGHRRVEYLTSDQPFPRRVPGVIFVREIVARKSKGARAMAAAAESTAGRVHIVGELPELELELTTFVPGVRGDSPGRFDAHAHLVNELAGLDHDEPGAKARDGMILAADAAKSLQASLVAAARGGRVGM